MADRCETFSPSPTGNIVDAIAMSVGAGDHTPTDVPNGFHCNTAGTLACRLKDATADASFTLLAGVFYPYRVLIARQTGTTAAGNFIYTK